MGRPRRAAAGREEEGCAGLRRRRRRRPRLQRSGARVARSLAPRRSGLPSPGAAPEAGGGRARLEDGGSGAGSGARFLRKRGEKGEKGALPRSGRVGRVAAEGRALLEVGPGDASGGGFSKHFGVFSYSLEKPSHFLPSPAYWKESRATSFTFSTAEFRSPLGVASEQPRRWF